MQLLSWRGGAQCCAANGRDEARVASLGEERKGDGTGSEGTLDGGRGRCSWRKRILGWLSEQVQELLHALTQLRNRKHALRDKTTGSSEGSQNLVENEEPMEKGSR